MNCLIKVLLLVAFFGGRYQLYGQSISAKDSVIELKIAALNKEIELQKAELSLLKQVNDATKRNVDLVIAHANNELTFGSHVLSGASVVIGIAAIIFAIFVYKGYHEIKNTEKEVDVIKNRMVEKETSIQRLLKAMEEKENSIENDFKSLTVEKERIKQNVETLKERFENESKKTLRLIDLYNQAYEKMNTGSIGTAIKKFNEILRIDESHIGAICKLAMCYSSVDDDHQAIIEIHKHAEKNGCPAAIYSTYGVILRRVGKYEKALSAFGKAIESDFKNNYVTYAHIGFTYLLKKEYVKAIEYFDKSIEMDGSHSSSVYGKLKTKVLYRPDDVDKSLIALAIKNAQKGIIENPKYPFPYFGLAFAQMIGNNVECMSSLKIAIEYCKNIGIIKEQLLEYKLFNHLADQFDYLNPCIDLLDEEIKRLKGLYA